MRFPFISFLCILAIAGCGRSVQIEVSNPLDIDRHTETVELDVQSIREHLAIAQEKEFVIRLKGKEVPYQITHDGKAIFQTCMKALETRNYVITEGNPSPVECIACGKQYPGKENDLAWENDKVGFRMYGHKSDVAAGYDLFAKRGTDKPVLESFYERESYPSAAWSRYEELMKTDSDKAYRFKMDTLSYHVDRGYGMDCYAVGPTLGAGVAALVEDGDIVFPYCYEDYEILDNGPVRFTVCTTFRPRTIGDKTGVIEKRIISLDAGSHLNRTKVYYSGIEEERDIVAGIVLREDGGTSHTDLDSGYISYPAPTQNADTTRHVDNGILYIGHVYPEAVRNAGEEKGHLLAYGEYSPQNGFEYYWGFGWNHADMTSEDQWNSYLETFARQLRNPLITKFLD